MNTQNYPDDDLSRTNSAKLIIQFLIVGGLLFAIFRASWWSFIQTFNFLTPAFKTTIEAVVFSIVIQYGPQPALFFMGVFKNRFSIAKRKRDKWVAENRKEKLVPIPVINDVLWNGIYLVFATFFFLSLSGIDFLTNLGEVNNTYNAANANGTMAISSLLYWVMVSFAFFVLWAEELAGNLFVFFFMTCEQLATMFHWKKDSFSRAQGFFQRALGPLNMKDSLSGQKPTPTYPHRNEPRPVVASSYRPAQRSVETPNYRPAPKPAYQSSRPAPTYHPVSYIPSDEGDEDE
jgi:hypothetical protein